MHFSELFDTFAGSSLPERPLMLDVARQAAIPCVDATMRQSYLPLRCVTRVHGIKLLADAPAEHQLPVRLDVDVKGVGRWQREMPVSMPRKEQMDEIQGRRPLTGGVWG